jgi:hypothetical protein
MTDEQFLFITICLGSLFLGRVVSNYFVPNPAKFLEAYGGCDCGRDECEKIDELDHCGKRYRRIDIQESKMTYKYCKIYNATQGKYAYDVSGEDDPNTIWESNDWNENDALVGFYRDDNDIESYEVIFCRPGYAIYIQSEFDKDKCTYSKDNNEYRIPPAMAVNLNNAYDTYFLHNKNYPPESESDNDDSDSDDSTIDEVDALHKDNQPIINFLLKCKNETDNVYKKAAYDNAIDDIKNISTRISIPMIDSSRYYYNGSYKYWNMGERMREKISEFILNM